jgi:hypothetical protein
VSEGERGVTPPKAALPKKVQGHMLNRVIHPKGVQLKGKAVLDIHYEHLHEFK